MSLKMSCQELKELGGLKNIKAELPDWPVSDDTVLHLATAEGLATGEVKRICWLQCIPLLRSFCFSRGVDWIDLIVSVALMRPHQNTYRTLLLKSPKLKVKSNFQSCLDLLLHYSSAQVAGRW